MDQVAKLQELEKRLEAMRETKNKAIGQLESLENQRKEVLGKLAEHGIKEEQLEDTIKKLNEELNKGMSDLERDLVTLEAAEKSIGGVA